jgi:hypothetical protein
MSRHSRSCCLHCHRKSGNCGRGFGRSLTGWSDLTRSSLPLSSSTRLRSYRIKTSDLQTKSGLSLLDIKIHSLLSYLTNLAFLVLLKTQGGQLEEHPVVDHLIEARTVLEKLRPLETKLRYQIEKLVKAATSALADAQQGIVAGSAEDTAGSTGCE